MKAILKIQFAAQIQGEVTQPTPFDTSLVVAYMPRVLVVYYSLVSLSCSFAIICMELQQFVNSYDSVLYR